jgi:amino acid transporter
LDAPDEALVGSVWFLFEKYYAIAIHRRSFREIAMAKSTSSPAATGYNFGTFQGVFIPSILTILGVIMFLRFGWVLGNVGLPLTLVIVTLATSITFLTGLSLSATATNMKVGGGGAYFIISRSLGVEVGSAIGLPLFLAQALGIAFYITGFAEAISSLVDVTPLVEFFPFEITAIRAVSLVTLLGLTLIALISASLALKTQLLIFACIVVSLVSFFMGSAPPPKLMPADWIAPEEAKFWVVFAVFFPAVTGIEAGIAMSGDLKKPSVSLPRGTIAAVLTGYVVYMTIPFFMDHHIKDRDVLLFTPLIMAEMAKWGKLIFVGVCAATLSSALGALLGAPRTLQALARDRVLPKWIGRGYGKTNDPHPATALSFMVAVAAILLGDLNVIAPVLSMFFLTSYGLINLSAGLEGLIGSPSWRPKFKFPWWGSMIGAVGCFATMLMINTGATFAAMVVTGGLYAVMKRRAIRANWGDMRYGLLMLLVRHAIDKLMKRPADERGWRPNVLAFTGSPQSRLHLIELSAALAQESSYLTLATIVPSEKWTADREKSMKRSITEFLEKRGVRAMIKLFPGSDLVRGAEALINGYGFGPIEPNIYVIGESQNPENAGRIFSLIQQVHRLRKNLVLVRELETAEEAEDGIPRRIDIWWRGQATNIGLMLTIAHQLQGFGAWKNTRIVLKRLIKDESERADMQKVLNEFVGDQRLSMEVEISAMNGRGPFELIHESSADADLVLCGLKHPGPEENDADYQHYCEHFLQSTQDLPVAFVLSAEDIDFGEIVGMG